jgi:hypothetical protein
MPSIADSLESQSPLQGPLDAGLDTLSGSQTVVFTQYVKLVLPLDGYVFWVRSDLVSAVMRCTCYQYMPVDPLAGPQAPPAPVIEVKGSLHYSTDVKQDEDQTMALNRVIFTSQTEVNDFNGIGPCVMYIGEFEGQKFAFNSRASFYKQAGLWHYSGDALYPALASQIVDDLDNLDTSNVIVSNSLPIWLTLNAFMPMYPSYLVQENLEPPYASVHIDPASTTAIGAAPLISATGSHSQLVSERVKITLYGLRNFSALDFQDYVFQYSLDNPDLFGIMDMPVMRDEKRTQSELTIIAQKKTFELKINYYQLRAREIGRQLILYCLPEIILAPL